MTKIMEFKTIDELNNLAGYEELKHPLIAIMDLSKMKYSKDMESVKFVTNFYSVFFKSGCLGGAIYGRKHYDFSTGVMTFFGANQSVTIENISNSNNMKGWGLFFHPDLIRRTPLYKKIKKYGFFSYALNEALHLSEREKETIDKIRMEIEFELNSNFDGHSHELIISHLELLLNYSNRFYGRQFITRKNLNKDTVEKLEDFLEERINSPELKAKGLPTVKECGEEMCLSSNYLSDLLKKETGKNTQEYIHLYLIDRAKNMLLNTNDSINEIAYDLGFEYPDYFSKLFKKKTGVSPGNFRKDIGREDVRLD